MLDIYSKLLLECIIYELRIPAFSMQYADDDSHIYMNRLNKNKIKKIQTHIPDEIYLFFNTFHAFALYRTLKTHERVKILVITIYKPNDEKLYHKAINSTQLKTF